MPDPEPSNESSFYWDPQYDIAHCYLCDRVTDEPGGVCAECLDERNVPDAL